MIQSIFDAIARQRRIERTTVGKLALLLFCSFLIINAAPRLRSHAPLDFYQFWLAGRAAADMGVESIYHADDMRVIRQEYLDKGEKSGSTRWKRAASFWSRLELTATPLFYSAFYLASSGDFETDYRRFQFFEFAVYVLSLAFLCYTLQFGFVAMVPLLWYLTHAFGPLKFDAVTTANASQLQLGLLVLLIVLQQKQRSGWWAFANGLAQSLVVLFKPNVVLLLIIFSFVYFHEPTWGGLRAYIGGIVAGAFIAWLIPAIVFGPKVEWLDWIRYYNDYMKDLRTKPSLLELILHNPPRYLFFLFVAIGTGMFFWWRSASKILTTASAVKAHAFMAVGASVAVIVLSWPMIHFHYFILIVPLCLFHISPFANNASFSSPRSAVKFFLGAVGVALICFQEADWGFRFPLAYSGAFLLLLLTLDRLSDQNFIYELH